MIISWFQQADRSHKLAHWKRVKKQYSSENSDTNVYKNTKTFLPAERLHTYIHLSMALSLKIAMIFLIYTHLWMEKQVATEY